MKLASIPIGLIAVAGAHIALGQAPSTYPSLDVALSNTSAEFIPGVGRDWPRFGSGLEDDRVAVITRVRFVSSAEDVHPIIWLERFGSGLEDDAPVCPLSAGVRFGSGLEDDAPWRRTKVLNQSGF